MADLEAVLADVSYLMAMEKSKCTPAARASKKIILPDPRYALLTAARFPAALRAVRYGEEEKEGGGGEGGGGGGLSVRPSVPPSVRLSAHPPEDLSPFPAPPFFRLFSSPFFLHCRRRTTSFFAGGAPRAWRAGPLSPRARNK